MVLAALFALAASSPVRDTYPRQPLDVQHYRFALTLADSVDRIEGVAHVRMRLTSALSSVFLDLANPTPARAGKGAST